MRHATTLTAVLSMLVLAACSGDGDGVQYPPQPGPPGVGGGGPGGGPGGSVAIPTNWSHDVASVDLTLDLGGKQGEATVVTNTSKDSVSLEVGGLSVSSVSSDGQPLEYEVVDGQLNVALEPSADAAITVRYTFQDKKNFDGWMVDQGVTFLWPTFCGNLYPCVSNPADGFQMTVDVQNPPADKTLVYPSAITADAPSYMFAIAADDFEVAELGTTSSGTVVKTYYPLAIEADALDGTSNLVDVFDFYETTYGAYPFGGEVASVAANWGGGDYGGMEHHPYWHVSSGSMYDEVTQAHEAAHGWFGNGVRIECWEDFTLSEGVTTYLSARGLESVGQDVWNQFDCELKATCDGEANTVALPDSTCNQIDIIQHELWSYTPYIKGAYFLRAVSFEVGEGTLDSALAQFYQEHVGGAARMQDLVDHLKTYGDATTIQKLADDWLRAEACPIDTSKLCN